MWRETIAAHRGSGSQPLERLLARLLTGRPAFLLAGLLDVMLLLPRLAARRLRRRSF